MWRVMLVFCLLGALPGQMVAANAAAATSAEARRVALVIGNGAYADAPLGNPTNDALAMSAMLRARGFEVIGQENATRKGMLAAISEFRQRLAAGGVGLFYFAGHGLRIGNRTVLLPVEADGRRPARLLAEGIDLDTVLAGMSDPRPGKVNLLILDTCLNNPFQTGASQSPVPPEQTLIAYATAPGHLAADGQRHGLYTTALLTLLGEPGRDVIAALRMAQAEVWQASRQQQWPEISVSLSAPLGFAAAGPDPLSPLYLAAGETADGPTMQYRGILPKDSAEQYELAFWESIKDSSFVGDYEAYLQAYPKGRFAALARARIERLRTAAAPKAETPAERTPPPATKAAPEKPAGHTARPVPERTQPAAPATRAAPAPAPGAPTAAVPPRKMPPADAVGVSEVKDCPVCPALIVLPRGAFTMGNSQDDPSEKPAHQVSINEPFAIGKYEVTVEQWNACAMADACPRIATVAGAANNAPVRDVSWDDAKKYVSWLSKLSGKSFRLPTEAEWEYAARGGTTTRYWWGDQMRPGNANCKGCGEPWQQQEPAKVGSFAANSFGAHDMNGSVWEWVADCWHNSYHGAPANGLAWNEPNCTVRVIRGGSWRDGASYMLSSTRFKYDGNVRNSQNGFRVAREVK
ncbi:MAG: SUMF1/EgtB/PvdO family nonheme iron enzyme [Dechloromonas sp.]|nr:SUMF1/EgtB/PvdO family nonheme iron enzyme [Dechloromonas sp.]